MDSTPSPTPHTRSHTRSHTHRHRCDTCGTQWASKAELDKHNMSHYRGKLYTCETCGKTYKFQLSLAKHKKIHTGEIKPREYKCSICGCIFGNATRLRYHMTSHSDKRPFACKTCGKSFKWKD